MADYQTCKQCFVRVRLVPGATYLCSACKKPLPGLEANAPAEEASAPPAPGLARSRPAPTPAEAPVTLVTKPAEGASAPPAPRRATVVAVQPPPDGAAPPKSARARARPIEDADSDDDRPGRKRERAKLPTPSGGIGVKRILGGLVSLLVVGGLVAGRVWLKMKPDKPDPEPRVVARDPIVPVAPRVQGVERLTGAEWRGADYPKFGVRADLPAPPRELAETLAAPEVAFGRDRSPVPYDILESSPVSGLNFRLAAVPKRETSQSLNDLLKQLLRANRPYIKRATDEGPAGKDLGFPATKAEFKSPAGSRTVYGWQDDVAYRFALVETTGDQSRLLDTPEGKVAAERFLKSLKQLAPDRAGDAKAQLAKLDWGADDYPKIGVRAELPRPVSQLSRNQSSRGRAVLVVDLATSEPGTLLKFGLHSYQKLEFGQTLADATRAFCDTDLFANSYSKTELQPGNHDLGFEATKATRAAPKLGRITVYAWESGDRFRFASAEATTPDPAVADSPEVRAASDRFFKSIKLLPGGAAPTPGDPAAPLARLNWVAGNYPKVGLRAEMPQPIRQFSGSRTTGDRTVAAFDSVTSQPSPALRFELFARAKLAAGQSLEGFAQEIGKTPLFATSPSAVEATPGNLDLGFVTTKVVRPDPEFGRLTAYVWEADGKFRAAIVEVASADFALVDGPAVKAAAQRFFKSVKKLDAPATAAPKPADPEGADPFKPAPAPSAPGADPFAPVPPKAPAAPAPTPTAPPKSPRPAPARRSPFVEAGSVARHLTALDTGRDSDFLAVEAGSRPGEFRVMRYSLPKCQLIGTQSFSGDLAEAAFDPEYQRLFVATTSTPLPAPGLARPLSGTGTVRMYSLKALLDLDRESRGESVPKGAPAAEATLGADRHVRGLRVGTDGEWVVATSQPPVADGKPGKGAPPQVLKLDAKTLRTQGKLEYARPLLTTAVNAVTGEVAVVPHAFNPFGMPAFGAPDPDASLELIDGAKWSKARSVRLDFSPAGAAYSAKGTLVVSGVRAARGVLVGINVRGGDEVANYLKSDDRAAVPYGEVQMRPDESELSVSPHDGRPGGYIPPGVPDRPDLPRRFVPSPPARLALVAGGKFLVSGGGAVYDLVASNKAFADKALAGAADEKKGGE